MYRNTVYYFVDEIGLVEASEVLEGKLDHLTKPPVISGPYQILAEHATDQMTVRESLIYSLLDIESAIKDLVCSDFTLTIDMDHADEEELGDYLYELENHAYQHSIYTFLDPYWLTWTLYTDAEF